MFSYIGNYFLQAAITFSVCVVEVCEIVVQTSPSSSVALLSLKGPWPAHTLKVS